MFPDQTANLQNLKKTKKKHLKVLPTVAHHSLRKIYSAHYFDKNYIENMAFDIFYLTKTSIVCKFSSDLMIYFVLIYIKEMFKDRML